MANFYALIVDFKVTLSMSFAGRDEVKVMAADSLGAFGSTPR